MVHCQGLTITDLEDLLEDIKVYMELEQGQNAAYWKQMTIIAEDELSKLRKIDPNTRGAHLDPHIANPLKS